MDDPKDTEIDVLRNILKEIQNLNTQLARIDERSQQNSNDVETLREDRIVPLETQADRNGDRSRRNSLILGAVVTLSTILIGAGSTYLFTIFL